MALLASPAVLTAPAEAMPAPAPGVPCIDRETGPTPAARRIPDTAPVSTAVQQRVERQVTAAMRAQASADGSTAARSAALRSYTVNVQIHIIHGRHKGEAKVKKYAARKLFGILAAGYNGAQSSASEPMGIGFRLKRITISKNESWYHARPMSRADKQMKKRLHRGTASTLNIYLNSPKFANGGVLLGFATFPWKYSGHKRLDGVTINVASLPGGRARGYNLGDTVIHETGHWLGLLHTFQGGCDPVNDGVSDTPAEQEPNFYCVGGSYGFPSKVCDPTDLTTYQDPAYNFMDYTFDYCMKMFTYGQHARYAGLFQTYRFGR